MESLEIQDRQNGLNAELKEARKQEKLNLFLQLESYFSSLKQDCLEYLHAHAAWLCNREMQISIAYDIVHAEPPEALKKYKFKVTKSLGAVRQDSVELVQ